MSEKKIALAVAGGGYRATLYSLGSLWRLNELGMLPKFTMITSVSGGSILTAYLALHWNDLTFVEGKATNFKAVIADPIQTFCSKGIDVKAGFGGLLSFRDTIGDKIAKQYDKQLYKGAMIADLSDDMPEFLFYGTNYQTGSSIQLKKDKIYDYKIGEYPNPNISLAKVVGVSSAFPPMFSPVTVKADPDKWVKTEYASHFDNRKLKKNLQLCDGGLYDNMGLEAVWKQKEEERQDFLFVCDAGAPFTVTHKIKTNWAGQMMRMNDLMIDQQRALRKRELIDRYKEKVYGGTYWGINTNINNYKLSDPMPCDPTLTAPLKSIRTRLNAFTDKEQGHLINWGYALTDTAMRKWAPQLLDDQDKKPGKWPIEKYKL